MISIINVTIESVAAHYVGNIGRNQSIILSVAPLELNDVQAATLSESLLDRFDFSGREYKFSHPSNLKFNEVNTYVNEIFQSEDTFFDNSRSLARRLYERTSHPKISGGLLFVITIICTMSDGSVLKGIVILKSMGNDVFFTIEEETDFLSLFCRTGIDFSGADKACLIWDIEQNDGFRVLIHDGSRAKLEAAYWTSEFLGVSLVSNDFTKTSEFLMRSRKFLTEQDSDSNSDSKLDRLEYGNRSIEYFRSHETFDRQEFEVEVFGDGEIVDSFRNFDKNYSSEDYVQVPDKFVISGQAVKKQARFFKSVLKLDRNFHIYIHGNRELIEQGVDEHGRKFYKLYYEDES